jgi:hypothetical protein
MSQSLHLAQRLAKKNRSLAHPVLERGAKRMRIGSSLLICPGAQAKLDPVGTP